MEFLESLFDSITPHVGLHAIGLLVSSGLRPDRLANLVLSCVSGAVEKTIQTVGGCDGEGTRERSGFQAEKSLAFLN